jgi:hypothetical protein
MTVGMAGSMRTNRPSHPWALFPGSAWRSQDLVIDLVSVSLLNDGRTLSFGRLSAQSLHDQTIPIFKIHCNHPPSGLTLIFMNPFTRSILHRCNNRATKSESEPISK